MGSHSPPKTRVPCWITVTGASNAIVELVLEGGATDRELEKAVAAGKAAEDLLWRRKHGLEERQKISCE